MKLFSLKKDNDSTAPSSEDANPSSQLAENPTTGVSDNALQLDTTNQLPMQATNYPDTSPNTSPEETATKNAFSLDSIDLNQLEDELLHGKTDYTADNTKAASTLAHKKLSFDDFDIDAPSQESLTVLTPSSSSSSQHPPSQHDQVLDDIQIDENEWQGSSPNNNINDINDKPVAALPLSDADDHPYQPPFIQNIDTTAPSGIAASSDIDMHAEPAALLAANPQVSAAAQTQKNTAYKEPTLTLDGKMTNSLLATTIAKPRKTPKKSIVYGALGLSLLAVGAWVFFSQSTNAPTTVPAPVKTAPKAAVQPVASTPAMSASGVIASTVIASEQASAAASTVVVSTLSPQDILKPALPQDPAIAQEELDRLAQQSEQLKEQEVMIQEQIRMMNELSDKKAERIKLLEQQVAKLEQQNNTAAKP